MGSYTHDVVFDGTEMHFLCHFRTLKGMHACILLPGAFNPHFSNPTFALFVTSYIPPSRGAQAFYVDVLSRGYVLLFRHARIQYAHTREPPPPPSANWVEQLPPLLESYLHGGELHLL